MIFAPQPPLRTLTALALALALGGCGLTETAATGASGAAAGAEAAKQAQQTEQRVQQQVDAANQQAAKLPAQMHPVSRRCLVPDRTASPYPWRRPIPCRRPALPA